MSQFFSDRDAIADYAERTARLVPGLFDMQRMAALLLAERAPREVPDARGWRMADHLHAVPFRVVVQQDDE
jgi:hypothetical protein